MEQGQENMPLAISSRLLITCMWIFCVIVSVEYSANLFTFLSLQDTKLPIQNLHDLSKQNAIRLLLKIGTIYDDIFKFSDDETMRRVNENAERRDKDTPSFLDTVRTSSEEKWAFVAQFSTLRGYEAQHCKTMAVLPEPFMTDATEAFAWPKNAFFADKMNALIESMAQSGFMEQRYERWFQKVFGRPCAQLAPTTTKFAPTDMTDLTGILAVYGVFLVAGGLIFVVELIFRGHRIHLCKRRYSQTYL